MSIVMVRPDVAGLREAAAVLREWQVDRAPMQLHPGDVGFHWRDGPERTAAAVRVWSRERIVAVGLLDAPQLLRMAIAPHLQADEELIDRVLVDIDRPERGVLDTGSAVVEARCGPLLTQTLVDRGWRYDEPWTPLHRNLANPVHACGLRMETIGPDGAHVWAGVHWSAFRGTTMTDDDRRTVRDRWFAMAASAPYAEARCLTAFDEHDNAVAVAGVWSADPDCSSRWVCTTSTDATVTAGQSPSRPRPRSARWDRRARSCARRVPTPALSRPTPQRASSGPRKRGTYDGAIEQSQVSKHLTRVGESPYDQGPALTPEGGEMTVRIANAA